jgi:2-keto-4-pentenoate hydratase
MDRSLAAAMKTDKTAVARVQRAAKLLAQARAARNALRALPDDARPQSPAEAYAIQDLVMKATGPIGGWKVGAKTPTAEPNCAPLCAAWIVDSPARFPPGAFTLYGIESELAFTLARDLPGRGTPYTEQELVAEIASVHPAVEIVDSRFADIGAVDALSLLADSLSHGALVVVSGVPLPASFAVADQAVELKVDDMRLVSDRGSNPAGDPFRLLAWLANHAAHRCGGLRRGQVVTTGSWTGMRCATPGARIGAHFSGIGEVTVDL